MNNKLSTAHDARRLIFVAAVLGGCAGTPPSRDYGPLTVTRFDVVSAQAVNTRSASDQTSMTFASAQPLTVVPSGMQFTLNGALAKAISVKVGQEVAFRNGEDVVHDIYSTSSLKTFDTGVLQNGESRTVMFDRTGTLDVQCAFHPDMKLTVHVGE